MAHSIHYGTKCGHPLHPSASPHTPHCPPCTTKTAQRRLNEAHSNLATQGGLNLNRRLRNLRWEKAKIAYNIALRRAEATKAREQRRWERETAWNDAHAAVGAATGEVCDACKEIAAIEEVPVTNYVRSLAWWEVPGALAASTTPRVAESKPRRPTIDVSRQTREVLSYYRKTLRGYEAELQQQETERVVRRKWNLGDTYVDPKHWNNPTSYIYNKDIHAEQQASKKRTRFRARGSQLHHLPGGSLLKECWKIDDVTTHETKLQLLLDEVEKDQRREKEAFKISGEVGHLYFVGSGLPDWSADVQASSFDLVWRAPLTVISSSSSGYGSDESYQSEKSY